MLRGVQEVAVKQLRHAGGTDLEKFLDVSGDMHLLVIACTGKLHGAVLLDLPPAQEDRSHRST